MNKLKKNLWQKLFCTVGNDKSVKSTSANDIHNVNQKDEVRQLVGMYGKSSRRLFSSVSDAAAAVHYFMKNLSSQLADQDRQTQSITILAESTKKTLDESTHELVKLNKYTRAIEDLLANAHTITNQSLQTSDAMNEAIERLNRDFLEIKSVAEMINSIADQTNLLALNATVEAARASTYGRGFAVVANSIKQLSNETKQATFKVNNKINSLEQSVTFIREHLETLGNLRNTIASIHHETNGHIQSNQSVRNSVAQNIETMAQRVDAMQQSTQSLQRGSSHVLDQTEGVEEAIALLSEQAEELSREMKSFTESIDAITAINNPGERVGAWPAILDQGGHKIHGRIVQISNNACILDKPMQDMPGSEYTIQISGIPNPLRVRWVEQTDRGCLLQFPLSQEHIQRMNVWLKELPAAANQ